MIYTMKSQKNKEKLVVDYIFYQKDSLKKRRVAMHHKNL